MDGIYKEVYEYLIQIKTLDEKTYHNLVVLYGTDVLHKVIDYMIDLDEGNLLKFDYYIDKLTKDFDKFSDKSNLSIYMQDIGRKPRLSHEDNLMYATKCYDIIHKLRKLFKLVDCKYKKQKGVIFNSIVDEVEYYKKHCSDKKILDNINELYDEFLSIREILVNGNIRLVVVVSKRYFRDVNSFIEIIQWGNMGLLQAVEKYNPNFNTRFVTYSYYWIRQSIRNAVRYQFTNAVTVSYDAVQRHYSKLKAINELTIQFGRIPTDKEVADYMGISVQRLDEIGNGFQETISLYSNVYKSGDSGDNNPTIADMFEDRNVNVDRVVSLKIMREELLNAVNENLDEMQRYIVLNRAGFFGDVKTFKEIGDMYGCTKQHIEQTHKRALMKLKNLSGYKLRDFVEGID